MWKARSSPTDTLKKQGDEEEPDLCKGNERNGSSGKDNDGDEKLICERLKDLGYLDDNFNPTSKKPKK